MMLDTFLNRSDKLKIIITSQMAIGDVKDISAKLITIQPLRPEDSLTLLKKKSAIDIEDSELYELMQDVESSKLSDGNKKTLKDHPLFQMVKGHPMALIMIASLRKEMRLKQIYELLALIEQENEETQFNSENIAINLSMQASLLFLKSLDTSAYLSLIIFAMMPAGISNDD